MGATARIETHQLRSLPGSAGDQPVAQFSLSSSLTTDRMRLLRTSISTRHPYRQYQEALRGGASGTLPSSSMSSNRLLPSAALYKRSQRAVYSSFSRFRGIRRCHSVHYTVLARANNGENLPESRKETISSVCLLRCCLALHNRLLTLTSYRLTSPASPQRSRSYQFGAVRRLAFSLRSA